MKNLLHRFRVDPKKIYQELLFLGQIIFFQEITY